MHPEKSCVCAVDLLSLCVCVSGLMVFVGDMKIRRFGLFLCLEMSLCAIVGVLESAGYENYPE